MMNTYIYIYSSFLILVILSVQNECYGDVGTPLFLTPLIENGKAVEARKKARVSLEEFQNIESYAGYFTVNKNYNSNLFCWYFPSQSKPKSDPVVLWLQGGPGVTSIVSIFTGNGPIAVNKNNTLKFRKYYWNLNHNVIYIDNPVGTGYSFTDNESGYATNENDVARDLYAALTQFFDLFPVLRNNEFYLTGESYAGKYIPALANEIMNKNVNAKNKLNLVGLAIGNGWTDPINQIDYSDYLYELGFIDDNGKEIFKVQESKIKDFIREGNYAEALIVGHSLLANGSTLDTLRNLTGYTWYYNYLHDTKHIDMDSYVPWVQKPSVRQAIHVGNNTFLWFSQKVYATLATANAYKSIAYVMENLIEHYKILVYTGQLDLVCPYPLVVNYLRQLKWSGAEEYKNSVRKQWWIENELAGYTKSVKNFTEVLVRNAGHFVTSDQPKWAWNMITNFTSRQQF